jgi:glucosamine--fructose-6-phosphate aminotransferase (isomerizing)
VALLVATALFGITRKGATIYDSQDRLSHRTETRIHIGATRIEKAGYKHFMAKEIAEQPVVIADALKHYIQNGALNLPEAVDFQGVDRLTLVACGTASYAGLVGAYAIEQWARIPVDVQLSHEFRYREPVISSDTLVVSISQSGETMDTLMAVKYASEHGARTISICNTQGATIPRESDAVIYTHAGPEVAVASTKAFVAQITALYLLGLHAARVRDTLDATELARNAAELEAVPAKIEQVLVTGSTVAQLAKWMSDTPAVLFLGRHVGFPIALEGALKLKELAYIHAEGFAAGELKHGPIALIDNGQPVFVIVPSPRKSGVIHAKVISNIQEIRARGARVIAIAEQGDAAVLPYADEVIQIPLADPLFEPFLAVVPLQIFAMELAHAKGLDVDQPRNLAKSVTVE